MRDLATIGVERGQLLRRSTRCRHNPQRQIAHVHEVPARRPRAPEQHVDTSSCGDRADEAVGQRNPLDLACVADDSQRAAVWRKETTDRTFRTFERTYA